MLLPSAGPVDRYGLEDSLLVDHNQYLYNPRVVKDLVQNAIADNVGMEHPLNLCIVDLTCNAFVSVRDPLLLALLDGIITVCNKRLCTRFAILLADLPGSSSASYWKLKNMGKEVRGSDYTVSLIANSGRELVFSNKETEFASVGDTYKEAVIELYGDPSSKLKRKRVRRLGHFQTPYPQQEISICRRYSYFLNDCANELHTLFSDWWRDYGQGAKGIVFDIRNQVYFRKAVQAFADEHSLNVARIADLHARPQLAKTLSGQICVLALDAVETGAAMAQHVNFLQSVGIRISKDVVAAINKSGAPVSSRGDYRVHGFWAVQPEAQSSPCEQCTLGLPHTPDSGERFCGIRAFDMFHMTEVAGYEPEPTGEVPLGGKPYDTIPKFSSLVNEFGDWIAYKIHLLLKSINRPENWFIVHPEEPDSSRLCDKLQVPLDDKLSVVTVPRPAITDAQKHGNSWEKVIQNEHGAMWVQQFESISGTDAAALILDIFNASDSTKRAFEGLLRHFDISPFCYLCLIDFDPAQIHSRKTGIPSYSLYQWYNPRELLREEGNVV